MDSWFDLLFSRNYEDSSSYRLLKKLERFMDDDTCSRLKELAEMLAKVRDRPFFSESASSQRFFLPQEIGLVCGA